jgi:hypothetical protein
MNVDKNWTATTWYENPVELTEEYLKSMLEKLGVPQGLVLLPSLNGYDVYQFPASLLKGAISLMQGNLNPFDYPQQTKFSTGKKDNE